jgi:hypothetical protein
MSDGVMGAGIADGACRSCGAVAVDMDVTAGASVDTSDAEHADDAVIAVVGRGG